MGAYGLNMGQSMFHGIASNRPLAAEQDKGKGKYRDADLEAAFEQAAASLVPVQSDASRIVEVDTAVDELSATLNNAKLAEMTEGATDTQRCVQLPVLNTVWVKRFKPSVWDELKSDPSLQNNADLGNWEEQLNHLMSEQREDLEHEFGADMQSAWERGLGDFDGKGPGPLDSDGFPVLSPYTFGTLRIAESFRMRSHSYDRREQQVSRIRTPEQFRGRKGFTQSRWIAVRGCPHARGSRSTRRSRRGWLRGVDPPRRNSEYG
jgi:hypothetical protein